jgi:hypothetical protein
MPVILYLEGESRRLHILPRNYRYLSLDMIELEKLNSKIIESCSIIDIIVAEKQADKFLEMENEFKQIKEVLERL